MPTYGSSYRRSCFCRKAPRNLVAGLQLLGLALARHLVSLGGEVIHLGFSSGFKASLRLKTWTREAEPTLPCREKQCSLLFVRECAGGPM